MKKQLTIFFLLFSCLSSWSQNFIKSTVPCNDALLQKTPGRWIKYQNTSFDPLNKALVTEMMKRIDNIQLLMLKTYPTPVGVDAAWYPGLRGEGSFSSQLKFSKTTDGKSKYDFVNGIPVVTSFYACGFFRYNCGREPNEIMTGYPGETTNYLHVFVNYVDEFFMDVLLDGDLKEIMRIDGRPINMMPVVKGTWKGNPLYYRRDSSANIVFLHRDGILPYIPVTRKQYLERCIDYIPEFYDPWIKSAESTPVRSLEEQEAEKNKVLDKYKKDYGSDPKKLKSVTDYYLLTHQTEQQQRDELVKKVRKQKEDQLKHYKDELEATTKAKLLDSPAIIPLIICNIGNDPIFSTEETGGHMLVTDNPAYIRKDLPKYIPQFMVMSWHCSDWKPQQDVCKAVNEYFPIEKLQTMIDK